MSIYEITQAQLGAKPSITPVACGLLQRSAVSNSPVHEVPPIVHEVLRSPGHSLDTQTRAFMESRFAHDFSGVRVHTDAKAAQSARAVNALAYTVGRDVVFGAGQYSPGTNTGKRLMAHELTHVVQQSTASSTDTTLHLDDIPAAEQEADHMPEHLLSEQRIGFHPLIAGSGLQRKPAPTKNSFDSLPLEEAIKHIPMMSPDQALSVLKRYQRYIIGSITSGEGRIRELISLRAESFSNYLIGGTIELFGRASLPSDNWEEPWRHVNAAYSTIAKRQIVESLHHLNAASEATHRHWQQLNEYLDRTEKGADRSIFALKAVVVAAAATELVLLSIVAAPVVASAAASTARALPLVLSLATTAVPAGLETAAVTAPALVETAAVTAPAVLETGAAVVAPAVLETGATVAAPAVLETGAAVAAPTVLETGAAVAAPTALETAAGVAAPTALETGAATTSSALSTTAKTIATTIAATTLSSDTPKPDNQEDKKKPKFYPIYWSPLLPETFGQRIYIRTPGRERDTRQAQQQSLLREWRQLRDPDFNPKGYHAHHVVPLFLGGNDDLVNNGITWPARVHLRGHRDLRFQPQMQNPPNGLPKLPADLYAHPAGTLYILMGQKGDPGAPPSISPGYNAPGDAAEEEYEA